MKTLIIYYSFEGNCELVARGISKLTSADILQLKLKKEIKSKGFSKFIWGGKQVMMKDKPDLEPYSINFDEYDMIYIGTPVWAGTYAPALNTFFSENKILNKKIGLFCCYTGSAGKTFDKMKSMLVNNQIVGEIGFKDPNKHNNEAEVIKQLSLWIEQHNI